MKTPSGFLGTATLPTSAAFYLLISTIAPVYAQSTVFENIHQVCTQLDRVISEELTQMENFPDLAAVEDIERPTGSWNENFSTSFEQNLHLWETLGCAQIVYE